MKHFYKKSWCYAHPYWWNAYLSGAMSVCDDFGNLVPVGYRNQSLEAIEH